MNHTRVRRIVHSIDKHLKLLKPLKTYFGDEDRWLTGKEEEGVCTVLSGDSKLVLKWTLQDDRKGADVESRVLYLTQDLIFTPVEMRFYDDKYVAILKTFMGVDTLQEIAWENQDRIPQPYFRQVASIVKEFHKRGISGVDAQARNFAFDAQNNVSFFDLDDCVFKDEGLKAFEEGIYRDQERLTYYSRKIPGVKDI